MEEHDTGNTEAMMGLLQEHLEHIIYSLAGEPLAFVLTVSDGREIATTTNLPIRLCAELLHKAHEGAMMRARGEL